MPVLSKEQEKKSVYISWKYLLTGGQDKYTFLPWINVIFHQWIKHNFKYGHICLLGKKSRYFILLCNLSITSATMLVRTEIFLTLSLKRCYFHMQAIKVKYNDIFINARGLFWSFLVFLILLSHSKPHYYCF